MTKTIDAKLIEFTEKAVLFYVKKKKYTKHKFDFMLIAFRWGVSFYIASIAFNLYLRIINHQSFFFTTFFLIFAASIWLWSYYRLNERKELYDEVFALRKNPLVYSAMKQRLEEMKEFGFPYRRVMVWVNLFCLLLTFFSPSVFILILVNSLEPYIELVFDFDEPDKYEEAKKEVSKITLNAWRNTIGNI